ncbi:MAG: sigma 54-interacting transcriptional regulator, partial [Eudoraea sp.]|uniref:sigma-54 interaction domain-containing protein n=1 Tax=Eudoraea sp. TaxID=1979955 RepID=UPI003C7586C3
MSDQLFVFFAGIALTTGVSYVGLGIVHKIYRANFIFGLFAITSGIYFLINTQETQNFELSLFFATAMFALFPWYFAFEVGYVNRKLLWIITGLCMGYFAAINLVSYYELPEIQYFFSYGVYILTSGYCVIGLKKISSKNDFPFIPLLVVAAYYIVFVTEEIAFNIYGDTLPWRSLVSFNYLDLFPVIIISVKLVMLVKDQWFKGHLEKSVIFYKENFDLILNQTKKFVLTLNEKGNILFANPYFNEFLDPKETIINTDFDKLLTGETRNEFRKLVFDSKDEKGNIVTQVVTKDEELTVAWSFVKLKNNQSEQVSEYTYLFGANITQLKKTEEDLRKAYNDLEDLKNKIQAENIQLRKESGVPLAQRTLIGESPNFNYVLNRIEDVATLNVPVLLEGETGVGKELFANAIHEKSARKENPFIKVNCAAIPKELMESELFGYEKGAFTGAEKRKKGMFELADRGTLFLDEIGDLPLSLQPKLLRALQDGEIQLLGAEKVRKVDVRIIAATNRSLEEEVEKGSFRSDLYYRINVFPITIPPLRQRKADIPLLVKSFVNSFNAQYHKEINQVSES